MDDEPPLWRINVIYDREEEQSETISRNATRIIHEEAEDTEYEPFERDYEHALNLSIDIGTLNGLMLQDRTGTPTLEDSIRSLVIHRSHDDQCTY